MPRLPRTHTVMRLAAATLLAAPMILGGCTGPGSAIKENAITLPTAEAAIYETLSGGNASGETIREMTEEDGFRLGLELIEANPDSFWFYMNSLLQIAETRGEYDWMRTLGSATSNPPVVPKVDETDPRIEKSLENLFNGFVDAALITGMVDEQQLESNGIDPYNSKSDFREAAIHSMGEQMKITGKTANEISLLALSLMPPADVLVDMATILSIMYLGVDLAGNPAGPKTAGLIVTQYVVYPELGLLGIDPSDEPYIKPVLRMLNGERISDDALREISEHILYARRRGMQNGESGIFALLIERNGEGIDLYKLVHDATDPTSLKFVGITSETVGDAVKVINRGEPAARDTIEKAIGGKARTIYLEKGEQLLIDGKPYRPETFYGRRDFGPDGKARRNLVIVLKAYGSDIIKIKK